jgi:Calcineurin-like phosphoesterase
VAHDTAVTQLPLGEAETLARGKTIVERLRRGDLPQMVDWFDPGLLAKVGVREVISSTLGSYTDQRLIQASTDNASEKRLKDRYNFSGVGFNSAGEEPVRSQALAADANGAVWVDYIADLGDGFEATYAMAYLLAADQLKVAGESAPLPAGQLLIMGGDQVYPDATKQEYSNRLRDPYDWAFSTTDPKRKLFAIPGNHDWYDGLSAFSALFCSARDRISKGLGTQIGGWRCHQHRSYFAIQLPHDWWIWGPDIQLADNLDDSQRDYFDLMADQTKPGDNIILCLAEPSWLHRNYDNMHEISMLARKRGAKICAIIAGDWHHYSRYTNDKLGIQFITAGGGGAFAHATHGLKNRIALNWATPTGATKAAASTADPDTFNQLEKSTMGAAGRDFTLARADAAAMAAASPSAVAPEPKPITDIDAGPGGIGRRAKAVRKEDIKSAAYECRAEAIYPPKSTSRRLCLKNLALPFRNRPFTYLVGIIYFMYAWVFTAADPRQSPITQRQATAISQQIIDNSTKIFDDEEAIKRIHAIAADAKEAGAKIKAHEQILAPKQRLMDELQKRQGDSYQLVQSIAAEIESIATTITGTGKEIEQAKVVPLPSDAGEADKLQAIRKALEAKLADQQRLRTELQARHASAQQTTAAITAEINSKGPEFDDIRGKIMELKSVVAMAGNPDEMKAELTTLQTKLETNQKLRLELQQKQAENGGPTLSDKLTEVLGANKGLGETLKGLAATSFGYVLDIGALMKAAELSPLFAFMLIGLCVGLIKYVESDSTIVKLLIGSVHAAAHIFALLVVSWFASATGTSLRGFLLVATEGNAYVDNSVRVLWNILVTLFVGGLLGGFVMGIYWTLTSTLFNMHTGDAFGALGIKDYKNFLRIKLEPGRATIYPIALDKVPARKGWRWQLAKGERRPAHNPQILPVNPLQPHMIEKAPIIIEANKVEAL